IPDTLRQRELRKLIDPSGIMLRTAELFRFGAVVERSDSTIRPCQSALRAFIDRHEIFGMNLQQAGPLPRPFAVADHDVAGISGALPPSPTLSRARRTSARAAG